MNYLDGYVEEVLSEPYYDDYGSGIFRWWVKVSYVCEGIGAVTTLSTRAIPLHRSLEYPLLDQFSFVYNPPSTCWMYMPLLIISEGFTPHPYLKSSSHDFCLQDSNN